MNNLWNYVSTIPLVVIIDSSWFDKADNGKNQLKQIFPSTKAVKNEIACTSKPKKIILHFFHNRKQEIGANSLEDSWPKVEPIKKQAIDQSHLFLCFLRQKSHFLGFLPKIEPKSRGDFLHKRLGNYYKHQSDHGVHSLLSIGGSYVIASPKGEP